MNDNSSAKKDLPSTIILMGVCGCGKTEVGKRLVARVGGLFEDGDDFHTDAAKEKMRSGTPLTDDDRRPWYARLRSRVEELRGTTEPYVLACSALKQHYRSWLADGDSHQQLRFVFLNGSFDLIKDRMGRRVGHYMPLSLLESQFAILEAPSDALEVSIDGTVDEIVDNILAGLRKA